jgi:hypothetical protein
MLAIKETTNMQQITVTTPKDKAKPVAKIALEKGISEASISQAYAYGPDKEQDQVQVNCSAPQAAAFIEAVMLAPFYNPEEYSITSDEIMAIVSTEPPEEVSRPMKVSAVNILQELWMQNQITVAFFARAAVSALLVAYGLLEGDLTVLIVAYLFTPFLTQDLAIGFGAWMRDWHLTRRGALVMGLSTIIAIAAGAVAAAVMGGPIQFDQFGTVQSNFVISALVGVVAGLDTADEAGRREFVAVAGAAQFAAYPVWLGIALITGFPDRSTTLWRIVTFFVNIITILVVSLGVYIGLRYRTEAVQNYTQAARRSG